MGSHIIGTFGAFIRIRSPIKDKRALLDVGCAGPLTGVLVAIPVILVGLKLSTVTVIGGGGEGLILGEPLLFKLLSWLALGPLTPEENVLLHPVAFAGWIGLLVTALNLIPVGQLDGGHVAYALFPDYHRYISLGVLGSVGGLRGHILARLAAVGRAHRLPWAGATRRRISFGCPWTGGAGCWGSSLSWCSCSPSARRPLSWDEPRSPGRRG